MNISPFQRKILVKERGPNLFVYVMRGGGFIKFGITKNLKQRHKGLDSGLPFRVSIIAYAMVQPEIAKMLETVLIGWDLKHANGEWFVDDGRSPESIAAYMRELLGEEFTDCVFVDDTPPQAPGLSAYARQVIDLHKFSGRQNQGKARTSTTRKIKRL